MTSCFKLIKAEETQSFTSGSFQRGTVSFPSSLSARVWGGGGERSILIISGVFAGELGTECLPSLSRKAETAECRQHEPSATHKANSAASTAYWQGKSETSPRSERANAEQAITSKIRRQKLKQMP